MVRKLVFGLVALLCAQWARATVQFYDNSAVVLAPPAIPPTIDAVNFINRNTFIINFTNFFPNQWPTTTLPYNTVNTRTFTNGPATTAFMSCNAGFDFESFFPASNQIKRASTFFNVGTIECGTATTSNQFNFNNFSFIGNPARMVVSVTNLINPGTINMGFETLLSLKGESVDLSRGAFDMEGSGFTINAGFIFFNGLNLFDGYWGIGDPVTQRPIFYPFGISPASYWEFRPYTTPLHSVTTRTGGTLVQQLGGTTNFLSYLSDQTIISNRFVRAAFVGITNAAAIKANVYFPGVFGGGFGDIIVEYTNVLSSNSLGVIATNNLYVADAFGSRTNFQLLVDGVSGAANTFIPFNYTFFLSTPLGLGTPTPSSPIPSGTFGNGTVTNQYSAYEAIFNSTSRLLSDAAGQDVTNLPGRIEITGDKALNLTRARIGSLNYLLLKSTNHFLGSSKAQITSPFTDLNLRSTNGTLGVTNLIAPFVKKPEGIIDCFSARWTNVVDGITNAYHVLFLDTKFAPTFPSRVETAILRANNAAAGSSDSVLISDNLNLTRTLLLDAAAVTLTTNDVGAANPFGTINLLSSDILWPTSTPRLKYLTNNGAIQTLNAVFFGGSRSSPYYNSNFDEPYIDFVNRGVVSNYGSLIWALDFQNTGTSPTTGVFYANSGSIDLEFARNTTLLNGAFLAPLGDIIVSSDTLLVSNHVLLAGSSINLYVTNTIDDGSLATHSGTVVSNKNSWITSGFSLPLRPAQGSLLGTAVTNTAAAFAEVINQWGAADYGCSSSGFTAGAGSAPLGALTLDGDNESQFTFVGTGPGANAIYVDYLEFKDFTTNRDSAGNFIGVGIAPNMTIYFANAVANGVSIAEKLNGKFGADGASGGHFCWVSGYAGAFSSVTRTNLNDGTPYQVNAALATDCNLDTDGDGIANCVDPDPLHPPPGFAAAQLALAVAMTNSPMRAAVVSWNTTASSTNFVYYKTMMSTNWQLLTNFISGPAGSRINVLDPVSGAGRLYRVRVDAPH